MHALKLNYSILALFFWSMLPLDSLSQRNMPDLRFDFYGDSVNLQFDRSSFVDFNEPLSSQSIYSFYERISKAGFSIPTAELIAYKKKYKLDDWLYYQLIRKTIQQISPKADNYHRYTLYKWFFLTRSGYNAVLTFEKDRLLFYVQSDENIYNIPSRMQDGKQYVCLNYHDYGNIDFDKAKFTEVVIPVAEGLRSFSYKVTQLPNFTPDDYLEKDIRFNYNETDYYFKVKLNPQVKNIFNNYPVVDFESYFNIPLSTETYKSLIPLLTKNTRGLSKKNGVDYLMRFTRYAFLFEADSNVFGSEKRLTPEQTLLYEYSDCEDRAALFFYLVKEIYNLPMIVLSYPRHVTIAVKFDKPVGTPIIYKGQRYSVCEPTPQKEDLKVGELAPQLRKVAYEVAYEYNPGN